MRFPALDALRAVGALMVVLTHVAFNTGRINQGWTGAALSRLDFGVALFFVVSGFLLSRPHFTAAEAGRPQPGVAHYLWKRALRILPLYWVVVVVALLVDPANRGASVGTWLRHLTLTQLYVDAPLASSLTQMWSLCTEVAFYLALPVLARLLARLSTRGVLAGCALLSLLGLGWAGFAGGHLAQWLPAYLPWFAGGVALAAISAHPAAAARLDRVAADLAGWWLLGGGLFAIACSDLAGPRLLVPPTAWEGIAKCALYGAAALCLVLPLIFGEGGRARGWLTTPLAHWLGEISYGVFCLHMMVLVLGMRLLGIEVFTGSFWGVLGFTLPVSLVLAAASYRWLESPLLRLKDRGPLARRDPATSATASSPHH
ncbi:acyltransferase family protein [Nocardioides sp.]|uniref:acyltransferase family protein n=1 Tax=Nocardioides sp. TaxID=35761 RepID=UPI0039E52CE4